MTKEIWKIIPGYKKYYEASDKGRIRSVDRHIRVIPCNRQAYTVRKKGKILAPATTAKGHQIVHLGADVKFAYVHSLVLKTFTGPRPRGRISRHLNGRPSDNRWINLEWSTHSRNVLDRKYHFGSKTHKLTLRDIRAIKKTLKHNYRGLGIVLARKYGVCPDTISRIRLEKRHSDVAA